MATNNAFKTNVNEQASQKSGETVEYIIGLTDPVEDSYEFGKVLGSGQYGSAAIAVNKATGQKVAIKTIRKSRFRSVNYQYECMRNEIEIMRSVDHPHIMKLFDVKESETDLHLIMELCEGGELFERIKEKRQYSEREAQKVLRQICLGLEALHSRKIAHCDLKPDNFLFVDKSDDSAIKIIDFGMSKALRRREYMKHLRGTPYYIAPEVLNGEYTEHCDMWSIGVVMFIMLFGFPPFHGDSDPIIYNRIRAGFEPIVKKGWGPFFPAQLPVSAAARDLISKLLTKDASARLSAKEVLEHPWMQGKDVPLHPLPVNVVANLTNFVKKSRFTNEILCYLTHSSMQTEEYIALAKTFRYIDKNNDGTLTVDEFKQALMETENCVLDDAQLAAAVELADMDGDGRISWKELLLATTARRMAAKEERLWKSFKQMDLNNDGKLSVQELELALGKDAAEVRELIAEVDKDNNGMVDYDEFLSVFCVQQENEQDKLLANAVLK